MKQIILVGILILASIPSFAQEGTVTGTVANLESETPKLYNIWTEPISETVITESDGKYSLELSPGEYDLFVGNNGLILQTAHIQVGADEKITQDFLLEDIVQLSSIQLFGSVNKQPEKLDQITRLPLKPNENIQTITTISEKVIERQGILTISDATRNAPGLYTYATYGNTRESLGSRGFRGIPILKNGVRVHSDFRGSGFLMDMQGVESVQVLKGAATITQGFGNDLGSPGGVVNLVTKTPKFENFGHATFRAGSWNQYRPTLDINHVLDKNQTIAVRINGAYEYGEGWRDGNKMNRTYINPSVKWQPSDKFSFTAEMDYLDDSRTPDPGTVNFSRDNTENEIYDLPKHKFLGFESDYNDFKNLSYALTAKYDFSDKLYLRAGYYASKLDTDAEMTSLSQIQNDDGVIEQPNILKRGIAKSNTREDDNQVLQIDLVAKELKTGNFSHLVQVGTDIRQSKVHGTNFKSVSIDQIDIFDEISNTLNSPVDFTMTGFNDDKSNEFGVLGQYVVEYKDLVRFFGAIRYSNFNTEIDNAVWDNDQQAYNITRSENSGNTWNPLVGVMIYPIKPLALFASYTTNSNPRSSNKLDKNGNELGLETSNQFELGVKSELFQRRLRLNATFYRVENNNMIMQDITTNEDGVLEFLPYYFKGGNDVRQGIEVEAIGRIQKNWEVMAGFSYLDAEYNNSTRFVDGSKPNNTPEYVANFWTNYMIEKGALNGLSLGAGVYYLGARPYNDHVFTAFHGITPDLEPWDNDAYTTVNAQIAYYKNNYGIQFLVNNIFDEIGYNAYRNKYINRIDPRNFAVKLMYKF
ncbi:TonB-dependent siderophore receptor [Weeksellaceae bacterium KMM 9724]|uniref:TonB-dependent siderophore receptor n=1 Tax=Profundicola chukchiensis TaxID=2961959 RepID=UPI00243D6AE1|nr:TonB-dependent siderophore receptor [Profundicola chukchiensis]MDG4950355.1 TonB-dependent siderophore receptor [Profundicola chukchiensis]